MAGRALRTPARRGTALTGLLPALGLALAAGIGAAARFALDAWARRRWPGLPWGTLLINVSGSFLLGALVSAAASQTWLLVLGVGLLGGYTTFSTASQESLSLLRGGRRRAGIGYAAGSLALATAAAAAGWFLGRGLVG